MVVISSVLSEKVKLHHGGNYLESHARIRWSYLGMYGLALLNVSVSALLSCFEVGG